METDSSIPPSREVPRYPVGAYQLPDRFETDMIRDWIQTIETFPQWLDPLIENIDAHQLATPYRTGGWSPQQIIHHLADAHMNMYIRLKLALTEDQPVVKTYEDGLWADLPDVENVPVNVSITLLHALHRRIGALLRAMEDRDWERTYYHPEQERAIPLWELADYMSWHGRHHVQQVRRLRELNGWR